MRSTMLLIAFALLAQETCAIFLSRHDDFALGSKKSVRQRMENTGDAQYTGIIEVGGQSLKAVMDTGSFELLVLSTNCTVCGTIGHLYNETASQGHKDTGFDAEHSFGSGTTNSIEAFDVFKVGDTTIKKQVFWQVYDANMALLLEDTFQAILGIGPPSSAVKFAQEDVEEVHEEFRDLKKKGVSITEKVMSTVTHYEELLEHAESSVSVVQNMELDNMSVCLGKRSLSDGYIIWNDHSTKNHPERFVEVDVVGDYYWSAEMTDVKFEGDVFKGGDGHLGCKHEKCSAVVDTGTTLIVAPPDVVDKVDALLQDFMAEGGTCDDVSKLPDLQFNLGGHPFSLPPESYVGRIRGELSEAIRKYMPHVFARQHQKGGRWGHDCESLLMKMDMDSQSGPLWILGMPLFRKYYTSFQFVAHSGGTPKAKTISFAVADDECEPSVPSEAAANELLMRTTTRKAELVVNASKIRAPRFVHRATQNEKSIRSKLSPGKMYLPI